MKSKLDLFKISNYTKAILGTVAEDLEIYIQGVNIPGFNLGELIISRPVVRDKRPGDTLTYNDLVLNVICDEALVAYKTIYNNMVSAADPETANLNVDGTVFDGTLFLTTNKNNIQHKILFKNCFIKSISDIELTSTSTEEEHFNFICTLGYTHYLFI